MSQRTKLTLFYMTSQLKFVTLTLRQYVPTLCRASNLFRLKSSFFQARVTNFDSLNPWPPFVLSPTILDQNMIYQRCTIDLYAVTLLHPRPVHSGIHCATGWKKNIPLAKTSHIGPDQYVQYFRLRYALPSQGPLIHYRSVNFSKVWDIGGWLPLGCKGDFSEYCIGIGELKAKLKQQILIVTVEVCYRVMINYIYKTIFEIFILHVKQGIRYRYTVFRQHFCPAQFDYFESMFLFLDIIYIEEGRNNSGRVRNRVETTWGINPVPYENNCSDRDCWLLQ